MTTVVPCTRDRVVDIVARFTDLISKQLPVDVSRRLERLRADETNPRALMIYDTMKRNQELAAKLNRPSCQDTGLVQIFAHVGSHYPLRDELHTMLKEAVGTATQTAPLRHNTVETFQEVNTGTNTGSDSPWIYWDFVEGSSDLTLNVYLAGGGCSLPGQGKTLMPGEGYEGAVRFVLDVMTSYGLNACPPLLVGVGIGTSIDSASYMSKRALMRPVESRNPNELVAGLEDDLEEAINSLGLGPQGLGGGKSVMGVNIENSARHPSVLSVAVNTGCWSHRRGTITIHADGSFESSTHEGFDL
ncbi:L(+)-tartrate dehydratase subunit alpha [Corynebacterium uberis]|uniref:L(+)-tartrate dehydratase subunit alpha n=1 Tax=Corynebacterium TaxID=1716 RepID=UPI001D0AB52D|nr:MULTISPECIES: L(+)-tartrate dehydratase subunit alpha [Corynebacterium]MCZ9309297.1 L(+)-tartrate dehydratase subunit alpha [Corynebacterium sp. c6VSa_13]UDL72850.1 L(+)-tartrate dehydratase subunit alpha [Corynebacterium uberis]UDL76272.1 L(+)-tartrate dehydratase subunit alpha [Corynebacterium uberis]UDL78485.1 L(+)-tartrate dehydratase subunit alpha [Corynebacterium uberis]UDL80767.1 L(+)-tartrate dehydratase subunit alpha [Corynebacterium uberis]